MTSPARVSSKWFGLQQRPGLKLATTLLSDARPSTDPEVEALPRYSIEALQVAGSAPGRVGVGFFCYHVSSI